MKLLLDTHYIVWRASGRSRLSKAEQAVLESSEYELIASVVSIWEIRLKWNSSYSSGERKGWIDPLIALNYLDRAKMNILVLDPETAATPLLVPMQHKDPFDELLLVHAQQTGARLFTRDRALQAHPLVHQSS